MNELSLKVTFVTNVSKTDKKAFNVC